MIFKDAHDNPICPFLSRGTDLRFCLGAACALWEFYEDEYCTDRRKGYCGLTQGRTEEA